MKEKTIGELVKEHPDKSYRDLERYRDADRIQEAQQLSASVKDEGEEQDNPVLFEKEIDYHRYWKDMYEKEHKLRQEAETETILVKGIGMNSPEMKAAKAEIEAMRKELDRVKLENNNLFTRVADALEVNEHHQNLNGKLQERITELEQDNLELHADNKKIARQVEDQVERARKAGM